RPGIRGGSLSRLGSSGIAIVSIYVPRHNPGLQSDHERIINSMTAHQSKKLNRLFRDERTRKLEKWFIFSATVSVVALFVGDPEPSVSDGYLASFTVVVSGAAELFYDRRHDERDGYRAGPVYRLNLVTCIGYAIYIIFKLGKTGDAGDHQRLTWSIL